jgi:hypothetical protein
VGLMLYSDAHIHTQHKDPGSLQEVGGLGGVQAPALASPSLFKVEHLCVKCQTPSGGALCK